MYEYFKELNILNSDWYLEYYRTFSDTSSTPSWSLSNCNRWTFQNKCSQWIKSTDWLIDQNSLRYKQSKRLAEKEQSNNDK